MSFNLTAGFMTCSPQLPGTPQRSDSFFQANTLLSVNDEFS